MERARKGPSIKHDTDSAIPDTLRIHRKSKCKLFYYLCVKCLIFIRIFILYINRFDVYYIDIDGLIGFYINRLIDSINLLIDSINRLNLQLCYSVKWSFMKPTYCFQYICSTNEILISYKSIRTFKNYNNFPSRQNLSKEGKYLSANVETAYDVHTVSLAAARFYSSSSLCLQLLYFFVTGALYTNTSSDSYVSYIFLYITVSCMI